jgi:hypothetical protein
MRYVSGFVTQNECRRMVSGGPTKLIIEEKPKQQVIVAMIHPTWHAKQRDEELQDGKEQQFHPRVVCHQSMEAVLSFILIAWEGFME